MPERSVTVGLLHPGEMGAAVGAALRGSGETVLWASTERSPATAERAARAGLEDAGTIDQLAQRADVVLCVCPPHAAAEVARALDGFTGIYVDANAISPETTRAIARHVDRYVDGGIIGPPPAAPGTTRLYLSGAEAASVAQLFAGTIVEARVVSAEVGAASAVKMAYAAWTKGSAALLLATRALARVEGVEQPLLEEWRASQPQLEGQSAQAGRSAAAKGWRWSGEMSEIADTFAAAGLPDGFHRAATEIYRRSAREPADGVLEHVLAALAPASAGRV
jgi:3-hydroxyisobutyrate dehydrogenase-like beta-hydroxyacid dehydrogenase